MDEPLTENVNVRDARADAIAPLIPEGQYVVLTVKLDKRRLWGELKVMVECELVRGQHDGVRLIWCAKGLPTQGRVPISSKLYRTIVMVLGKRPEPGERISEKVLLHKMFVARVRTVTKDAGGRPLMAALRYCSENPRSLHHERQAAGSRVTR